MSKYSPFERRHRSTARWSLYASALLSGLVVFGLTRAFNSQLDIPRESSQSLEYWESVEEVSLLQRFVQIDTSERELEGALFLAEQLRAIGLQPTVEELAGGRANVWAIIEGERPEAIVLHNHIDVFGVVRPKRWEVPPFGGLIEPPFLYGRGAFDMKSLTIAQLQAMRRIAEGPDRPKFSVIFLATADEERGSLLGARWILREHPELVDRFAVVLTEGGVVEPVRADEIKYWGIETAQKRFVGGFVCSENRAALAWLSREIARRRLRYQEPRVTPAVVEFLETYSATRDDDYLSGTLDRIVDGRVDPIRFQRAPLYLRSLFLNELVAFPIEELEGGTFRMRLALHLLPGADFESVLAERLPSWMTHGLEVKFAKPLGAASGSSTDSRIFRALRKELLERFPGTPVGPHFLGWTATDARFFREAGIPTYGYSPFLIFNTESYRADQVNERINLPGFIDGVELYVDTIHGLANRPDLLD